MANFKIGTGFAQAMAEDETAPASDEIFVHGDRPEAQWSQAMGENGTIYRWVRQIDKIYRDRPRGGLAAKLRRVIIIGRSKGHKRYAGPVIDEPDSFRQGNPGYDCSSFVALMYKEALGIHLDQFTDTIADETDDIDVDAALPGDIILYRYYDSSQPGVRYPHTGLWLGGGQMLDCQFPAGLGTHDLLDHPFEIHRARGL